MCGVLTTYNISALFFQDCLKTVSLKLRNQLSHYDLKGFLFLNKQTVQVILDLQVHLHYWKTALTTRAWSYSHCRSWVQNSGIWQPACTYDHKGFLAPQPTYFTLCLPFGHPALYLVDWQTAPESWSHPCPVAHIILYSEIPTDLCSDSPAHLLHFFCSRCWWGMLGLAAGPGVQLQGGKKKKAKTLPEWQCAKNTLVKKLLEWGAPKCPPFLYS